MADDANGMARQYPGSICPFEPTRRRGNGPDAEETVSAKDQLGSQDGCHIGLAPRCT